MRTYKKLVLWGLIILLAYLFWSKTGVLTSDATIFSSFDILPTKEELIQQSRNVSTAVAVDAYDTFIFDTTLNKIIVQTNSQKDNIILSNAVKIHAKTSAAVPLKQLNIFQVTINEDSVAVKLPEPQIITVQIDSAFSIQENSLKRKHLQLSNKINTTLELVIRQRMVERDLYSIANNQCKNTLGNYYKLLGFKKVYFN
jgi:hypothetical protein